MLSIWCLFSPGARELIHMGNIITQIFQQANNLHSALYSPSVLTWCWVLTLTLATCSSTNFLTSIWIIITQIIIRLSLPPKEAQYSKQMLIGSFTIFQPMRRQCVISIIIYIPFAAVAPSVTPQLQRSVFGFCKNYTINSRVANVRVLSGPKFGSRTAVARAERSL